MQVNPVQIHFDLCSCLWLNSFALNLHQSLLLSSSAEQQQAAAALMYIDVKLEAIMPRVSNKSSTCIIILFYEDKFEIRILVTEVCLQ